MLQDEADDVSGEHAADGSAEACNASDGGDSGAWKDVGAEAEDVG